jgi:serine/threonine-protein kinase
MDFGLAKLIETRSVRNITAPNMEFAIGTPGYMCPEQARGEEMDHRGDLYAVGVILYQLLTGRLPFEGMSTMDTLLAHATEEPPPFASVGAGEWVPPAIEAVVMDCLAKLPQDRPASARDLAERYETALAHEQVVRENELAAEDLRGPSPGGKAPARPALVNPVDPNTVTHQLEAWMPETIAAYKLRGFVHDVGGEVIESVPGRIRVRLGGRGSSYGSQRGWLSFGRRLPLIEMELLLQRAEASRDNLLNITVMLRPAQGSAPVDGDMRRRCAQIFIDLRGYLMGSSQG